MTVHSLVYRQLTFKYGDSGLTSSGVSGIGCYRCVVQYVTTDTPVLRPHPVLQPVILVHIVYIILMFWCLNHSQKSIISFKGDLTGVVLILCVFYVCVCGGCVCVCVCV